MTAATVRRRRTPPWPEHVAVTGAASGLGAALVSHLSTRLSTHLDGAGPRRVTGLDVSSGPPGSPWYEVDVRDPLLASRLGGVDVLVHLATSFDLTEPAVPRRALNVRGTASVLEAARSAGVSRVVLITSADVYGARAGNTVPLLDDAPLRATGGDDTLLSDLVEVERLAGHALRTGLPVTVLRPALLVGLDPSYDAPQLRQLAAARLLALRGVEPQWQLCHLEDLLAALELAVRGVVTGGLAVAGDGALPQTTVELLTGRRRLELPAAVALSTAERLHRLGVTTSDPRELDHLLGPLVVACDGLRAAGWVPAWTHERALAAHLAARPQDRSGALPYTAAGATVALLGSAALVRRRRRRPH